MKTKTNNEAVNETITFFDKKINNVIDVLYNYSLLNNIPECIKLDKNTQKQIIEDTINYYLTKIESLNMRRHKMPRKSNKNQKIRKNF